MSQSGPEWVELRQILRQIPRQVLRQILRPRRASTATEPAGAALPAPGIVADREAPDFYHERPAPDEFVSTRRLSAPPTRESQMSHLSKDDGKPPHVLRGERRLVLPGAQGRTPLEYAKIRTNRPSGRRRGAADVAAPLGLRPGPPPSIAGEPAEMRPPVEQRAEGVVRVDPAHIRIQTRTSPTDREGRSITHPT